MHFHVTFKSAVPVYLQLVEQVKAAAATGLLQPGDALPTVRALAEQLRVNRNTVARAYGELEREGVIDTVTGKGSFVAHPGTPIRKDVRLKLLAADLDALVVRAHHLRIGRTEFLRLAQERFDHLEERRAAAAAGLPSHE
jgi:GntR family transcriptional regulator